MMRIAGWNPTKFDQEFVVITMDMLREGAQIVAANARANCPVGTIRRPVYKTGKSAGKPWTERNPGALKRSVRVVEKHDTYGKPLAEGRDVRVYIGNRDAYYAAIVEYSHPTKRGFLRRALNASREAIRSIIMGKAA